MPSQSSSNSGEALPETSDKFGLLTARLRDVVGKEVVYVGVKSSNEYFTDFKNQIDSFFELKTRLVKSKQ